MIGDASSYTLTNGGSATPGSRSRADSAGVSSLSGSGTGNAGLSRLHVQNLRYKFQADEQLPKPRDFTGGPKRYRAGRGSSVPLDLGSLG
jgi:hypothetical protein